MPTNRVVITGIGVISAVGHNCDEFLQALSHGKPGINTLEVETFDCAPLQFKNAAQVRDFIAVESIGEELADLLDRFAQFVLVSAREAVKDAQVDWEQQPKERVAVITGSCLGGQTAEDKGFLELYKNNRKRLHPLTIPRTMANAGASIICMEFGIRGPAFTLTTACSSASHAIGQAYWMVHHGLVDIAITGGSEAPFNYGNLKAWEALRVIAPDTCRPFSKDRRGIILGEGGAILVLESLAGALARGAKIYAELVGFGMSSDAHHITQPCVDGPVLAIRTAIADADLEPQQIGYINAHGTGTIANDAVEASAIHQVFGDHAARLAVSSTKSMHGHTLGAAGAIEAVATILALKHGILPPTANYREVDPGCDLDVVPNEARPASIEYALSNSFAFGGLNSVLVFKRWDS
ncbi:MAG: beta-ketoacyl-[acyl-carrier-protein] synthase family protein [Acidobacteriota bacterium]